MEKQSSIIVGCMRLAGKTGEEMNRFLHTALDNGLNWFDHADIYGGGRSEEKFGETCSADPSLRREDVILQSKCGICQGYYDLSKEHILRSVEGSLRRSRTEYLDVLLLHRPDALVEPEEVAEAFDCLAASGKVRAFGVSNHKPAQIELLRRFVRQELRYNQLQFSIPVSNMIASGMRNGKIVRELSGEEKAAQTTETLAGMGLRSSVQESPANIDLPAFLPEDEPLTFTSFRFSPPGAKTPVVDIPKLSLAAGEITAITGANGAGKTSLLSLLRCICGLERRSRGILAFRGKAYDRRARRKLCFMVMQDTGNQLFTENVLEEVLISLPRDTENGKEQAAEILRRLDLEDLLDRHPQSLSGGQKQRLAIACALASGRELLLLDEPTSGLDYAHMLETAGLLKQLQARGITIFVVTHDSELIRACCTRKYTVSARTLPFPF